MAAGVRLTGLWWRKDQNGKDYLEGQLGQGKVRVYINNWPAVGAGQQPQPDAALFALDGGNAKKPNPGGRPYPPRQSPYPNQPRPPNQAPRQAPPGPPIDDAPFPTGEDDLGF